MSKKSFEIPESLTDLTVDEALDHINTARAEIKDLLSEDVPTDEQLERAEALKGFIDGAKTHITETREAEAKRAERIAALKEASEEEPEDKTEEPADKADDAEEPEDKAEEPAAEPEAVEEQELEAVAASAKTPKQSATSRAARNAKEPEAPVSKNDITITAAADINGITAGAVLADDVSLTAAAMARLKAFPRNRQGGASGMQMRAGIATIDISTSRDKNLIQGESEYGDDQAILAAAADETRLKDQSLVAAGGWCAPTETLESFCSEVSTDGILDLPTMVVRRGSIRYTKGPDFQAIFDNADGDWTLTETQVIGDAVKPCIEVECPTWDELTLDVTGVCVKAGILTNAAYPELVRAYIDNVLIAHQHKIGARLYQGILAASTEMNIAGGVTTIDGIGHLEVAADLIRQKKRMRMDTTVEVLLPFWYKSIIRGDVAKRTGIDLLAVNDSTIQSYFATRNLSVQWLYNTGQDIVEGVVGADGIPLSVPATVMAEMYVAGTFIKLTNDLITLEGLYDSTQLSTNTYTALFTEEGYALANLCGDGYKIKIPTNATGETGAANQTAPFVPATV